MLAPASAALVAPTAIAFFSGGFFDEPRLITAVALWLLLTVCCATGARPWARGREGALAFAGLVALTGWVTASIAWAPLLDRALDDGQRLLLYVAALGLATIGFRDAVWARWAEPLLALGAVIVTGYGLIGRLLPAVAPEHVGGQALGRLDQPITYWNAVGVVAAIGVVLGARVAGDVAAARPRWVIAMAGAACAPLAAALYLSFSRGAILAAVIGLLALAALDRDLRGLRATAIAAATGLLGALAVAFVPKVVDPRVAGDADVQGLMATGLLVVVSVAGATALRAAGRAEAGTVRRLCNRVAGGTALALVVVGFGLTAVGVSGKERVAPSGAGANRLGSTQSERHDYWRVAFGAFEDRPLWGSGSGGFKADWRREQPDDAAPAADAHSLYLETAGELGLIGLLALAALFAGVGLAGARVLRGRRELAVGPLAALAVWAFHAGVDWDWEMPSVSLIVLALAGLLLARSEALGLTERL